MNNLFKDIRCVNSITYPFRCSKYAGSYRFCFDTTKYSCGKEFGVAIFDKHSERLLTKIPFTEEYRIGKLYCFDLFDYDNDKYCYSFYSDDLLLTDVMSEKYISRNMHFGMYNSSKLLKSSFIDSFDWEGDKSPNLLYKDTFMYLMHVRGFTKHTSSGTMYKGTFKGIIDKIPYLKELGVTTIELQPAYEFCEYDSKTEKNNYWGYCIGNYYVPKLAYAYTDNASTEFMELVKALHKVGMEVVMQFYFPDDFSRREIPYILEFWKINYHIDGFHVLGVNIPTNLIDESPILSSSKIMLDNLDGLISNNNYYDMHVKKYALYRDDYLFALRKFLKGDDNSLSDALFKMKFYPSDYAVINYLDSYNTFTLYDMVSYDRKHNEENGEDNRDGNDYNASWNCGVEGTTRKQRVLNLRKKQIRNALVLLFLSSSVPMIFMGDEFGNSQKGNNNPYCHDSSLTWLDWKNLDKNRDIYDFVLYLAKFRREKGFLNIDRELSMVDMDGSGYPELSYHSEDPWKSQLEGYKHNVGVMFSEGNLLTYVALNMHWNDEVLYLPKPPKGMMWKLVTSTDDMVIEIIEDKVKVPERTIAIFETISNE